MEDILHKYLILYGAVLAVSVSTASSKANDISFSVLNETIIHFLGLVFSKYPKIQWLSHHSKKVSFFLLSSCTTLKNLEIKDAGHVRSGSKSPHC